MPISSTVSFARERFQLLFPALFLFWSIVALLCPAVAVWKLSTGVDSGSNVTADHFPPKIAILELSLMLKQRSCGTSELAGRVWGGSLQVA